MGGVSLDKLVPFLDNELVLSQFPKDESVNGLQVEGKRRIRRVGVAVDACEYVFRKASEKGIDLLIVHHGLIWGGLKSITGITRDRIKALLEADISLYACHLPLDWHPKYGNNARLLKLLSVKKTGEFGEYHGRRIGYRGRLVKELSVGAFAKRVDNLLHTKCVFVDFGRKVRNLGVVSGGGWSAIGESEEFGLDTFLTGEPSHSAYAFAEEMRVNLIFAGHYATETLGVRAVGNMLKKKFGLAVEFIDHPTGL